MTRERDAGETERVQSENNNTSNITTGAINVYVSPSVSLAFGAK